MEGWHAVEAGETVHSLCKFGYKQAVFMYLIHFLPKSVFQGLLFLSQFLFVSKQVEMSENTDDLRKAVDMADVDKLKSFHLIIKARIDHQQNLTEINKFMVNASWSMLYRD